MIDISHILRCYGNSDMSITPYVVLSPYLVWGFLG